MRDSADTSAFNDRLTHFLLVIWCTIGSFRVMSLTSCRLWDNTADHKGSITHKLLSWDNIPSMLLQCHLPTDNNNIRPCHQDCGDNKPVFHSVVYWSSDEWLILFSCEGIGVLLTSWWTFARIYHSIWRPPTALSTYFHLTLMCSLTKMHTQ